MEYEIAYKMSICAFAYKNELYATAYILAEYALPYQPARLRVTGEYPTTDSIFEVKIG
jgi:hypothetical protein